MRTRVTSIESEIQADLEVEVAADLGLEAAELEMMLALHREEGAEFGAALTAALERSGNTFLFEFPAARFPIPASQVAAVRIETPRGNSICYAYETRDGHSYRIADEPDLDDVLINFADSYSRVATALEPILARDGRLLH